MFRTFALQDQALQPMQSGPQEFWQIGCSYKVGPNQLQTELLMELYNPYPISSVYNLSYP